jgi:hypothetical protein
MDELKLFRIFNAKTIYMHQDAAALSVVFGAQRDYPVGVERFFDKFLLAARHAGQGEPYFFVIHDFCLAMETSYRSIHLFCQKNETKLFRFQVKCLICIDPFQFGNNLGIL